MAGFLFAENEALVPNWPYFVKSLKFLNILLL